jgi:hypothetical protein
LIIFLFRNGVKSTVDPCSKLIRVKSRLDPSDPFGDEDRWSMAFYTATKNMSLALLTTAVSMAHPKRHLKLQQSTWKIEAIQKLNKALEDLEKRF